MLPPHRRDLSPICSVVFPSIPERRSSAYSGMATNVQEYLIESIVDPLVYIAPGDWLVEDLMGGGGKFGDFDQALTAQNVADLIAWMYTIE